MNLISLIGASKEFGINPLFEDLSIHIQEGERLGLIGPNGAGKSTLLKVLAGKETLIEGDRKCSSRVKLELVSQDSVIQNNNTVLEEVLANCGNKRDLLLRFNSLSHQVAKSPNELSLLKDLGHISEQMDASEAWGLENQCKEVLSHLGISDLYRPAKELSGGYQKRVRLASALVSKPDLLSFAFLIKKVL